MPPSVQGSVDYLPGGTMQSRSSGGEVAGAGGVDMNSFLLDLLKRRERERQMAMQPRASLGVNTMGLQNSTTPDPHAGDPNWQLRQQAEAQGLNTQIAQQQALRQPPPMRMVGGPGVTPGYMPDTNAMSAIQRQLFLPQGSSRQFSPGEESAAGMSVDESRARRQREDEQRAQDMRAREGAAGPINPMQMQFDAYGRSQGEMAGRSAQQLQNEAAQSPQAQQQRIIELLRALGLSK